MGRFMEQIGGKLPLQIRQYITEEDGLGLEEIRARVGQSMEFCYGNGEVKRLGKIGKSEMEEFLNYLSGYSLYAYEEEIRQGFFTIEGGHRVGVTGHTSCGVDSKGNLGQILNVRDINGVNVRVAHEHKGCAAKLVPMLWKDGLLGNTLILARPGAGKTTYLRDCIRILSGSELKEGMKICVVDERSEIAASCQGVPQNDLGTRTDVLDNCPKSQGMRMVLRSMSPQIIAMDELGGEEDFEMLYQIIYSGSRILGTVHGDSLFDIVQKPYIQNLLKEGMLQRLVWLQKDTKGQRSVKVFDERLEEIC